VKIGIFWKHIHSVIAFVLMTCNNYGFRTALYYVYLLYHFASIKKDSERCSQYRFYKTTSVAIRKIAVRYTILLICSISQFSSTIWYRAKCSLQMWLTGKISIWLDFAHTEPSPEWDHFQDVYHLIISTNFSSSFEI